MNRTDGGFTYIGLMITIMILGIMMGIVGQSWKMSSKREKEADLIWIGHQYRRAISMYYNGRSLKTPHPPAYPQTLDDLIKEPRTLGTIRYLRKKWNDPMTGKDDWVFTMDGQQHIRGVHSASDGETLKRDGFDWYDRKCIGKTRYSEWLFEYDPTDPGPAAAVTTSTGGANIGDKPTGF